MMAMLLLATLAGSAAAAAAPLTLSDSKLSATFRADGTLTELKVPGDRFRQSCSPLVVCTHTAAEAGIDFGSLVQQCFR
jgi:hypothetical protein